MKVMGINLISIISSMKYVVLLEF